MTPLQFEKLVSLYGNGIYGFCCHLTGDKERGEELYQDTMLKALELRNKIVCINDLDEEIIKCRNYCMGIAVRIYKNKCRREWRDEINYSINDEKNNLILESASNPEQEN